MTNLKSFLILVALFLFIMLSPQVRAEKTEDWEKSLDAWEELYLPKGQNLGDYLYLEVAQGFSEETLEELTSTPWKMVGRFSYGMPGKIDPSLWLTAWLAKWIKFLDGENAEVCTVVQHVRSLQYKDPENPKLILLTDVPTDEPKVVVQKTPLYRGKEWGKKTIRLGLEGVAFFPDCLLIQHEDLEEDDLLGPLARTDGNGHWLFQGDLLVCYGGPNEMADHMVTRVFMREHEQFGDVGVE